MDRRSTGLEGRGVIIVVESSGGGGGALIGRNRENVLDQAAAIQDGCLLGVLLCECMTRDSQ